MLFEADFLDKWEYFFLHLLPEILDLQIVFIGPELNCQNLPLEIISRQRYVPELSESAHRFPDFKISQNFSECAGHADTAVVASDLTSSARISITTIARVHPMSNRTSSSSSILTFMQRAFVGLTRGLKRLSPHLTYQLQLQ